MGADPEVTSIVHWQRKTVSLTSKKASFSRG